VGAPTPTAGQTPTAGGATTLQLAAATIAAGSKQTVQGTTRANGTIALIIDYANGTQLETSAWADASGKFSYSWVIPNDFHGAVHVLADGTGSIRQASFMVE
jgi:hypothetical protein